MGSIYQTGYSRLEAAMRQAKIAGLTDSQDGNDVTRAMIQRGTNQSQTVFWGKVLNGIYTPKGSGGVLGDVLNKVGPR